LAINTLYFIYNQQVAVDGLSYHLENGIEIIDHVTPGGAAEKAGIRQGDILMTIDSLEVQERLSVYRGKKSGDVSNYGIIRESVNLTV
jgi:S1-C subfamily serine protease